MRGRIRNAAKAAGIGLALALPLTSCHSEKRAEHPAYNESQKTQASYYWYDNYYKPAYGRQTIDVGTSNEAAALYQIATLNDKESGAFYGYIRIAAGYDLETPKARKTIAETAVRLTVLNRNLVEGYFEALGRLVDECEDDKKGFEAKVGDLLKKVDTEVKRDMKEPPSDEMSFRAAITRMENLISEAAESC
ncbi:hypothetical protein JXA56_05155 [Candidatus Micrarchaeota archaeon]|nr:hypothetical protein [Candidatus Micrarchaeota archaeon]